MNKSMNTDGDIVITIPSTIAKDLVRSSGACVPELETTRLHMDASMSDFLKQLSIQYGLELLQLFPTSDSDQHIRDYKNDAYALQVQLQLIRYLLDIDSLNTALTLAEDANSNS